MVDNDLLIIVTALFSSFLCVFSIFFSKYAVAKTYKGYHTFVYEYVFKPQIINVQININGQVSDYNNEFHFLKVYDFGNYIYCYLSKTSALIVKKDQFFNGTAEELLEMFRVRNINIITVKWHFAPSKKLAKLSETETKSAESDTKVSVVDSPSE
jgi:hypothetical protein